MRTSNKFAKGHKESDFWSYYQRKGDALQSIDQYCKLVRHQEELTILKLELKKVWNRLEAESQRIVLLINETLDTIKVTEWNRVLDYLHQLKSKITFDQYIYIQNTPTELDIDKISASVTLNLMADKDVDDATGVDSEEFDSGDDSSEEHDFISDDEL